MQDAELLTLLLDFNTLFGQYCKNSAKTEKTLVVLISLVELCDGAGTSILQIVTETGQAWLPLCVP